jgi:hypothetical protein
MNQHPLIHQLVILSIGWAMYLHLVIDLVLIGHGELVATNAPTWSFSLFFIWCQMGFIIIHFFLLLIIVLNYYFWVFGHFSLWLDFTYSYLIHLRTTPSTTPTLVPYIFSPIDITILIINYPIELATILTTYPTNLATLKITYLTDLISLLI